MTSGARPPCLTQASCISSAQPREANLSAPTWILAALMLWVATPGFASEAPGTPARVVVLSTLHRLHGEVAAYDFETFGRMVERLDPDVLCLEVQDEDLVQRGPEQTKQEYPRVIYPLIARMDARLYALEPAEPLSSRIGKPYMESAKAFQDEHADQAKAFKIYADAGLQALQEYWTSPARVNDATTDSVWAAKHALQIALVGPGEQAGWEAWNKHFLTVIARAARENPGRRIVVTVGVEHAYWLRAHLAGRQDLVLEDTANLLATIKGAD